MDWTNNPISRSAVVNPTQFDPDLWKTETLEEIQYQVAKRLQHIPTYVNSSDGRIRPLIVPLEQIKNVVDSISQSNMRIGTKERIEATIAFIVSYLVNEETVNQTPVYDKRVTNYDGTFGIQRMPQGQLGIKEKGLNPIGRMF